MVGKPGSGKTETLKMMLNDPSFYNGEFSDVFVVSPSYTKMELDLPPDNMTSDFSINWLYDKFNMVAKE